MLMQKKPDFKQLVKGRAKRDPGSKTVLYGKNSVTPELMRRITNRLLQNKPVVADEVWQKRAMSQIGQLKEITSKMTTASRKELEESITSSAQREASNQILNSIDVGILRKNSKTQAVEIAKRAATRGILKEIRKKNLPPKAMSALTSILNSTNMKIPRTNITIYPPREILFIKLVNALGENGEKKALALLKEVHDAGMHINKMANKANEKQKVGDAFINAGIAITATYFWLEAQLMNPASLAKSAWNELLERNKAIFDSKEVLGREFYNKLDKERDELFLEINTFAGRHGLNPLDFYSN
ncbi:Uncharacterised protein [uncultured archaeon]|nr:Uncharacterised protein [uncultured archaeon]